MSITEQNMTTKMEVEERIFYGVSTWILCSNQYLPSTMLSYNDKSTA